MAQAPGGRAGWLVNLVLAGAVSLLMLYALEGVLRLLRQDPAAAAIERAEQEGRPYDLRSRMEVVRALRAEGIDAVPRIIPAALLEEGGDGVLRSRLSDGEEELLPLAGISGKQVVLCNENGPYAGYESDEHGFRNPRGLWRRAPVEVVLIGDSFTLGECVDSEAAIGARLRRRHPETVNLGMGGHGPLLQLATLREFGPVLRPEVVLWIYFENDLWWFDLGREQHSPLLLRYLEEPGFRQGLVERQPEVDRELATVVTAGGEHPQGEPSVAVRVRQRLGSPGERALDFGALGQLRRTLGRLRHPVPLPWEREPPDYALYERVLRGARHEVGAWGGTLVFVYLPGVWSFEEGGAEDPIRERVLALARGLGLPTIDVEEPMRATPDPRGLYSFRGMTVVGPPHMNAEGYALTARVILEQWKRALGPAERGS